MCAHLVSQGFSGARTMSQGLPCAKMVSQGVTCTKTGVPEFLQHQNWCPTVLLAPKRVSQGYSGTKTSGSVCFPNVILTVRISI